MSLCHILQLYNMTIGHYDESCIFVLTSMTNCHINSEKDVNIMSINDLLDADILPPFVIVTLIFILVVIPVSVTLGKKHAAEKEVELYGDSFNLKNEDEIIIAAEVIDKRSVPHPHAPSVSVNYLLFEQRDGVRKEFAIRDINVFGTIIKGDVGILKYYSNHFVSFDIETENK